MFSTAHRTTRFTRKRKLKPKAVPMSLMSRPRLLEFIEDLVHDWPTQAALAYEGGMPAYPSPFIAVTPQDAAECIKKPHIAVIDGKFFCNDAHVDLSHRPLMLRLVAAFCAADGRELSSEDILKHVYLVNTSADYSARYLRSKYRNAVRLMSRARKIAEQSLSGSVRYRIEWFIYDQERDIWCLSRPHHKANGVPPWPC